jgi:lysophospholipase L1-like esterase
VPRSLPQLRPASTARRLLCTAALAGCARGGSSTDPAATPALALVSAAPARQLAGVGEVVVAPPAVRTVDARSGAAREAAAVRFTGDAGDTLAVTSALTGGDGLASAERWALGGELGTHAVSASAPGAPTVRFEVVALPRALAQSAAAQRCPIPAALVPAFHRLPHAAAALRGSHRLTVVAIGSSTTQGVGASSPALAYPARLQAKLAAAFPADSVVVLNRGVGGDLARQTVARFERDVFAAAPDLVIWQTGTNDLLQKVPLESFTAAVVVGVRALGARGVDVVLMDSQRFPLAGETDAARLYQRAIATVADAERVPLVPRYAWMTEMMQGGRYDFGDLLAADGLHMNDTMHDCVAHYAAAGVIGAVAGHPAP